MCGDRIERNNDGIKSARITVYIIVKHPKFSAPRLRIATAQSPAHTACPRDGIARHNPVGGKNRHGLMGWHACFHSCRHGWPIWAP
ncbi:hypothetical protein GCM10011410_17180 [Hoyosella rhizosphaerae]|uniref:Transposase n=1 Tax=Hoyosella rhizosphaerae TaxID=1755582 RepID=A0A916U9H6_9ACTN|nr:hypothetical protein GCM10011410_17180 [Hoyosella rhizosphaerae]